jgi:GTPase
MTSTQLSATEFRCGAIALVGRPNAGKSTLFNALVGAHLSITAPKPQTTRHRIMGVRTDRDAQFVFIDSPGFQRTHRDALSTVLNRTVEAVLAEADVIGWVVEAGRITPADLAVAPLLPPSTPKVLIANKVDRIKQKDSLLPWLQDAAARFALTQIVPVSAKSGTQLDVLLNCLRQHLPLGAAHFDEDQLTDRTERFLAAELLREQLFQQLDEEIPFGTTVAIESFREQAGLRAIHATIFVAKDSHKAIVIGKGGARLKEIGTRARRAMEQLFDGRVHLQTWVKVKPNWTNEASALRQLGLHE